MFTKRSDVIPGAITVSAFSRSIMVFTLILMFCIVSPQPPTDVITDMFEWPKWTQFYDCIVGISVNGKPTGLGVFIQSFVVITSANLFGRWRGYQRYYRPDPSEIEVFAINGTWNTAVKLEIDQVTGNQVDRNRAWVKVGYDNRHTTIHDFYFITFVYGRARYAPATGWFNRTPYSVPFYWPARIKPYSPYGWKYAAFGFVDKPHVQKSLQLEIADYTWEAVLEDCDEWIPRPWGRFICLANIDNYMGIQAGAPLFQGNELYGLGAFELNKGNESILVFSELKPYMDDWAFYFYFTAPTTTTRKPYIPWYVHGRN